MNKIIIFTSEKNMNDIAFFLCRGGWPNIVSQELENSKALKLANLYYSNLISYNLDNFFDNEKDLKLIEAIIKVYARNVSTMASNNILKRYWINIKYKGKWRKNKTIS